VGRVAWAAVDVVVDASRDATQPRLAARLRGSRGAHKLSQIARATHSTSLVYLIKRCFLMTPEQIDLVRKSFDALWPFRRKLAAQFYGRFFELVPDARRLFTNDMDKQQLKLMDAIAAIVGALDQREMFQSIISHTGRKHAEFGVREADFVAFGDALLWGLQQQLGPEFSPELKQAWTELYDAVQAEMMRAARTQV
jgi:hemoglobin-like flavoprotein